MRVIFLGPKRLRFLVVGLISLVLIAGISMNWEKIAREIIGVKAGIELEGQPLQGLLPNEVAALIKLLAGRINRPPRNAFYFQETGEIIPAQAGIMVDVAFNVNRVFSARPGSHLRVMVNPINPTISEEFFKPVYHGRIDLPRVALAINVAWGEEYLGDILKTLRTEKVKATFFFVGSWVKVFPELVRNIAEDGHEIANHGSYHGHPEQMGQDELRKMILENSTLLTSVISKKPAPYFAPPYGELNSLIINVAGSLNYRTVMWSVDSIDWKNPTPEVLLNRVLSKIEPGGIILLHPTIATKEALPSLIRSLRKKGLEPGTVSSVL
ncbi:MAG TPA: polysaccharide deacetylase [Firmicutes bacterium]|nr:polysaccharide deacetylase [Bacillota bacterium]